MNYTAEDFHLHYIPSYTLCIHADYQLDKVIVLDQDKNVLVYMSYDNLSPSKEVTKLLSLPFQKVIICLPHQNVIWVPSDVYDTTEKELYKDYFVNDNIDDILVKEISHLGVHALFQYDRFLQNKWVSIFPEAIFKPHFEQVLLQSKKYTSTSGAILGVHLYDNQADIFLFINNEMRLYNTFEVATPDDLSYFLLNVFQNFAIEDKLSSILLSGTSEISEWRERLSHYAEKVILLKSSEKWITENVEVIKELEKINVLIDSSVCV